MSEWLETDLKNKDGTTRMATWVELRDHFRACNDRIDLHKRYAVEEAQRAVWSTVITWLFRLTIGGAGVFGLIRLGMALR